VAAYVAVTRADVEGAVNISEAEARAWYASNPEQFREPETRIVKYIAFPAKDFLASVEIPEEDALDYYNDHIDRYTRAGENGATTNIPFAEAKPDVIAAMTQEAARLKASDAATDFAVSLAPVPGTTPPSFEAAAAQIKKPVQNLGPFAMGRDELKGIENPIEFQRAAFQLAPTPDEYFSNAITGSNTAYVVALDRIIATHIPTYETIAAEVMKVTKDNAVRNAMQTKAADVRDRITKAMQKGASFKDAATAEGLQPVVTPAFSMSERLEKDPYAPAIVQGVIGSNPGEVADPIATQDAVVVVSLVERTPADSAVMGALREELVRMLQQSRGDLLYQSWMMDKLSPAKFVDSITRAGSEDEASAEDDSTAADAH
jgi:peptidyl-prolyl cis-trans isomerase D